MWSSQTAVLLLLFVIYSPGEAFEFPGLFEEISDCVEFACFRKIEACEERHGEDLTDQLKGCIAERCRESLISCVDWMTDQMTREVVQYVPSKWMNGNLLQSARVLEPHVESIVETAVDSYLYCFKSTDFQNTTQLTECVLGNLLDRAELYIKLLFGVLGFSDPGFMMCYLRRVIRSMVSCSIGLDEDYSTKLEENVNWEITVNQQEYMTCMLQLFRGKNCFQMFSRIYGSTPDMLTHTKGHFICMLNGLVESAAAC